jgi:hypothetical protein
MYYLYYLYIIYKGSKFYWKMNWSPTWEHDAKVVDSHYQNVLVVQDFMVFLLSMVLVSTTSIYIQYESELP